jgi:4-amino-4-deoxy-L-arabinose transferase-like glycosyltransferase
MATDPAVVSDARPAGLAPALVAELRRRWFELGVAACALAVGSFLLVQLTAWPPHEDETLALFVGRKSIPGLLDTVLDQRGGAPLHFLFAWIVAHAGGGLVGIRLVSAIFATATVPVVALLAARIAGRTTGLAATVLCSASWMLLFHGVYGRMYSLFLFTSALSFLALLNATEKRTWRAWILWALAMLLCVAAHPYGALVLAAQGAYVLMIRVPVRVVVPAFATVFILGIPFWRTDLVLAGRFDVGVGKGATTLGSPGSIASYLEIVAGDFTSGYTPAITIVLLLALVGYLSLARRRPRGAVLVASVVIVPLAALILAKLGSAAPMSRHLIFILPFFALVVAEGLIRVAAPAKRWAPLVVVVGFLALLPAEVAWGMHRTPELYRGEAGAHVRARAAAAAYIASVARPDDVLFGYEPLYLEALDKGGRLSKNVVPRADATLALSALQSARKPLGHGLWVFDASDTTNTVRKQTIPLLSPDPPASFDARAFGPYLVIRTTAPTDCVRDYLKLARRVEVLGASLGLGDADVNLGTVLTVSGRLGLLKHPPAC